MVEVLVNLFPFFLSLIPRNKQFRLNSRVEL